MADTVYQANGTFCHELDHLGGILFIDKIVTDATVSNIKQWNGRQQWNYFLIAYLVC